MATESALVIDLFCGLGGWAEGFLAEGYDVIGFDVERHDYGPIVEHAWVNKETGEIQTRVRPGGYPGQLVLQDVLTIHGSQFRNAACIVASPPCQEYSYMAMPWTLAKAKAAAIRADETGEALRKLTALFDACFRIQREASEAAGRYIPMVVENVRGAQSWVGRAPWNLRVVLFVGGCAGADAVHARPEERRRLMVQHRAQHRKREGPESGWPQGARHELSRSIPLELAAHIARCFLPRSTKTAHGDWRSGAVNGAPVIQIVQS